MWAPTITLSFLLKKRKEQVIVEGNGAHILTLGDHLLGGHTDSPLKKRRNGESKGVTIRRSPREHVGARSGSFL